MTQTPARGTRARSEFDEGELAFQDELTHDDCPYPMDSAAGTNWLAGWDAAQYENDQTSDDDAYNDPRTGQAAAINRGQ